jgi:oligopeptide/dipeptide ABC transporter ATP-binding protein
VTALLEIEGLRVHFPIRRGVLGRARGTIRAVDGVSLTLAAGETLGLVGESGCGKSTLGNAILRIVRPTAGAIRLGGLDMAALDAAQLRAARRRVQMVFQDPYASLNPRLTAGAIIAEPLENYGELDAAGRRERVRVLLEKVGLRADAMQRYPFEFSGGQRQRLGLARALALQPELIVADEPVSALDVSVQAQVLNLMMDLQEEFRLAYLFVSHDLGVVEHIGHRIAVMYLGKIVEVADKATMFRDPQHPYAQALIAAAPVPNPRAKRERIVLEGDVPSPINPPSGCRFHTRCPYVMDRCKVEEPKLKPVGGGHLAACHLR